MTKQLWFYEMMSQEFGPVPASEIRQLIADGMLSSGDRVRRSSSETWITAAEIADAESVDEADAIPNIDDFTFESPQPTSPRSPARAAVAPEPEPEVEEEAEPEFYIQSLGHVLGPLTQQELVEMAISGSVSRGDEIRDGEDGSWVAVEAIPALQTEIMRQSSASAESSVAASTTAKPTKRRSKPKQKPVKAGSPPGKAGPPRKRKRKKPKTDDFLQEIFSEVFTTEGKLREDLQSDKPKPVAAAASAATTGAPSRVESTPVSPVSPVSAVASPPAASQNNTGSGFAPPHAQPARPAFRPSPSKKSNGFDISDPKVLGIAGGILALILLVTAGFTGMLPMTGSSSDTTSFFADFTSSISKAQCGTKEDWNSFRKKFAPTASSLILGLKSKAQTDPEAQIQHKAARLVYQLLALPHDDVEGQDEVLTELKKVLASDG